MRCQFATAASSALHHHAALRGQSLRLRLPLGEGQGPTPCVGTDGGVYQCLRRLESS